MGSFFSLGYSMSRKILFTSRRCRGCLLLCTKVDIIRIFCQKFDPGFRLCVWYYTDYYHHSIFLILSNILPIYVMFNFYSIHILSKVGVALVSEQRPPLINPILFDLLLFCRTFCVQENCLSHLPIRFVFSYLYLHLAEVPKCYFVLLIFHPSFSPGDMLVSISVFLSS